MSRLSTVLPFAATLFIVSLALMWPAFYNGQPIFFNDSTAYIRGADAGIQAAFHHRSEWSPASETAAVTPIIGDPSLDGNAPIVKSLSSIKDKTILTGRSPFYGALLYLGDLTGGFWLSVFVQSIAMLAAMMLVFRCAKLPYWPYLPVIGAFLAATTTEPFFVSFLMPDIFAAVAILTAAVVLGIRQRLSNAEYLAALVLMCPSAIVHDSHALILLVMLFAAIAINLLYRSWNNWRGLALIVLALGGAVAAQSIFNVAVQHAVGAAPLRTPYLMARVIDDGPGYDYLRTHCPASRFIVCNYVDRMPVNSDAFLWEPPPVGVFAGASPEIRRQLTAEQMRFVLAVIAYEPWGQLWASVKNAAEQLTELSVVEFSYDGAQKNFFAAKVPAEPFLRMQGTPAYRGTMPIEPLSQVFRIACVIAAAFVLVVLCSRKFRGATGTSIAAISRWTLLGIAVNAGLCGILSGPHNRYSARVLWLVPFIALLLAAEIAARRGHSTALGGAAGDAKNARVSG